MIQEPLTGEEVPESKVSRSLSTNFVESSSLPSWLSTAGATDSPTLTFHPLTAERGEIEFQSANDDSYLVGPEFDPTLFEEIRFRVSCRTQLTGGNFWILSLGDSGNSFTTDNNIQIFQTPQDDTLTLAAENSGSIVDTTVNYNLLTGSPFVIELRIKPDSKGVEVIANQDQVIYSDEQANYGLANLFPRFRIDTRSEGTTESAFLGEYKLEFVHS